MPLTRQAFSDMNTIGYLTWTQYEANKLHENIKLGSDSSKQVEDEPRVLNSFRDKGCPVEDDGNTTGLITESSASGSDVLKCSYLKPFTSSTSLHDSSQTISDITTTLIQRSWNKLQLTLNHNPLYEHESVLIIIEWRSGWDHRLLLKTDLVVIDSNKWK